MSDHGPVQQHIIDAWKAIKTGTLYATWKAANPGASAKLDTYWTTAGAPEGNIADTPTGKGFLCLAKAAWAADKAHV